MQTRSAKEILDTALIGEDFIELCRSAEKVSDCFSDCGKADQPLIQQILKAGFLRRTPSRTTPYVFTEAGSIAVTLWGVIRGARSALETEAAAAGDERRHVTKISVGRATTSRTGPTKYEHFVIIHNNAGQDFSQHMRHKPEEALFLAMELALFMGVPCDPLSIDGKQIELDDMLKSMLPDEPDDEALSRHKDDGQLGD